MKDTIKVTSQVYSYRDIFHKDFFHGGYSVFQMSNPHEYVVLAHGNPDGSFDSDGICDFQFAKVKLLGEVMMPRHMSLKELVEKVRDKYDPFLSKIILVSCYNGLRKDCIVSGVKVEVPVKTRVKRPIFVKVNPNGDKKYGPYSAEIHFDTNRLKVLAAIGMAMVVNYKKTIQEAKEYRKKHAA